MELDLLAASSLACARVRALDGANVLCDDGSWADRLASAEDLRPGDEVVLCAVPGRARPVVIGRIGAPRAPEPPREVIIAAGAALALRCGNAGITMRGDGRVLIEGLDIASRARRLNRIVGGSVAIN